jgi:hypothetical protein
VRLGVSVEDNLLNINDVMAELEGLAIRTSQGTFVKQEDVRRLLEKRIEAKSVETEAAPKPKTMDQARAQAKKFLADAHVGDKPLPNLGKAIPATEPQPPSRA